MSSKIVQALNSCVAHIGMLPPEVRRDDHHELAIGGVAGNAAYSEVIGHRVISLHRLGLIYKQMTNPQPSALLSLQDAVEEGVRKGYWEMDYDERAE